MHITHLSYLQYVLLQSVDDGNTHQLQSPLGALRSAPVHTFVMCSCVFVVFGIQEDVSLLSIVWYCGGWLHLGSRARPIGCM